MMENNLSTRYVDRFPDGKSPISLAFLDDDSNANYTFYKGVSEATPRRAPAGDQRR